MRPPGLAAFVRARKRIDAVVHRMIETHRHRHSQGDTLLDLMLAASPDRSAATEKSLRDQVITIFLAGYETVANALSWTWYLLSQNSDCERLFHEEIDRELQGRLPTYEDIPRLRYMEMVMAESMRLYPPAWAMLREASCTRAFPFASAYAIAPSFRVTVSFRREVEIVMASSPDSMLHFAAGQLSLITTKSVRLGNVAVGEYRTRMIESEQTCNFKVPVPMVKRMLSVSC